MHPRYSYVRNNPVNFTDPTGHRECGTAYEASCRPPDNPQNVRIFYVNGLAGGNEFDTIEPNINGNEYASILAALEDYAGDGNVEFIPVYNRGEGRGAMLAEAYGSKKPYANRIASVVELSTSFEYGVPLGSDERLILVGSSAGGTAIVEALDILDKSGITVDQVILRGSFVGESWMNGANQVDYIAADPPTSDKWNYSLDWNPFDEVTVNQHIVPNFSYHSPSDAPTRQERRQFQEQINSLIINLISE